MRHWLQIIGWLVCVVYSTIPAFWMMIHPFAERWRARRHSPYLVLLPVWMAMWVVVALVTRPWHDVLLYREDWLWSAAALLFACGLCAIREKFQREATQRAAGSSWQRSRSATSDGWNPFARAASDVPGPSVRDAGMDRRDRPRSVLGPDGVRGGHGSGDDPDGGCGAGEEVWRLLPRVSQCRARGCAASMGTAPAIIRCN